MSESQKREITGGFGFSVILGIISLINIISMIIPPIVDAVKSNEKPIPPPFVKKESNTIYKNLNDTTLQGQTIIYS